MDVWKQKPNWGDGGVKLTLQYNTNIVESRDGNEKRSANRFNPRLAVQFADVRWGDKGIDQRREHRAMMQKDFVYVPLWTEGQTIDFYNGNAIAILNDCVWQDYYKISYITNGNESFLAEMSTGAMEGFLDQCVFSLSVIDGDNPPAHYFNGWRFYPCLPARITEKSSYTALTAQHSKPSVKFDAIPGQYKLPAISPAGTMIDGKEVFDFVQNWRTKPKVDLMANRDVIDNGRAAPWVNYSVQFVSQMIKLSFLNFTPEGTILFMDFFRRHRGMAKSFLFPGESRDFEIESVIGANVLQLKAGQVQSLFDHYSFGQGGKFRGYISIKIGQTRINGVRKKVFIHRRVQGTTDALDQIVLDQPLPVGFDLTQVVKCSILYTARFATDSLTISYKTPLQAEMNCGIQIIPFEDTP